MSMNHSRLSYIAFALIPLLAVSNLFFFLQRSALDVGHYPRYNVDPAPISANFSMHYIFTMGLLFLMVLSCIIWAIISVIKLLFFKKTLLFVKARDITTGFLFISFSFASLLAMVVFMGDSTFDWLLD